jgi:Putative lipoprotein
MKKIRNFWAVLAIACAFGMSACGTDSKSASRLYMQAIDEYAKNNTGKAIELADESLKNDRNFYPSSLLKGKALYLEGDVKKAEEIFLKLAKKYPAYTEARLWLLRCYINENKLDEASKLLDTELSFNQTDWRFYYQYAIVAERRGNYEERISMLQRAEQHANESGKVFLDLARVWYALDLRDRAMLCLDKADMLLAENETLGSAISTLKGQIKKGNGDIKK